MKVLAKNKIFISKTKPKVDNKSIKNEILKNLMKIIIKKIVKIINKNNAFIL